DYFGHARTIGSPDIGAVEFRAGSAVAAPPVRLKTRARFVALRVGRHMRTTTIRVRTHNSTRFTVTALLRGHVVAAKVHAGSARTDVRLTLATPRHGRAAIRIRASGPGGDVLRVINRKALP